MHWIAAILAAALLSFVAAGPAAADAPGGSAAVSASVPPPTQLAPDQRDAVLRELVSKFQDQVRNTPNGDVRAWSAKLAKVVATADPANLLRATTMPTLETMRAALNGYAPNAAPSSLSGSNALTPPATIGSTIADTTYTPLPFGRCKVAASKVINSPLTANVARLIDVEDISSYAAQGGNGTLTNGDGSTACGIPSLATAFVVSVVITEPAGSGTVKLFAGDQTAPEGNTILVSGGSFGATADLIVRSCQTCALELGIQSSVPVHYAINVIGYFMPPQATALQCQDTPNTTTTVGAGLTANVTAPTCPAGYTQTATNCESGSWQMPFVFGHGGTCSALNNGATAAELRASRTCCRVPGR